MFFPCAHAHCPTDQAVTCAHETAAIVGQDSDVRGRALMPRPRYLPVAILARRLLLSFPHETQRRARRRHDDAGTAPRRARLGHRDRADDRADPANFDALVVGRRACPSAGCRGTRAVAFPARAATNPTRCRKGRHAFGSRHLMTQRADIHRARSSNLATSANRGRRVRAAGQPGTQLASASARSSRRSSRAAAGRARTRTPSTRCSAASR